MSYLPEQFDESHVRWIYHAIRAISDGNLAANVLADFESGAVDEVGKRDAKAARILSWIALEAIDALERLPEASQATVAHESNVWPVAVRPKVVTSLGQIGARLKELRFSEGLEIDLNHSARSAEGKNVPVEQSSEPGTGLARRLYEEILAFKSSFGDIGFELDLPRGISIEDFDPNDGIQFEESSKENERREARRVIVAARVHLHFLALLGRAGKLTRASANLWSVTALRWLQHQNDGALVHDVLSKVGPGERLSPYIPKRSWESTKCEAARTGKHPIRLLEHNVLVNLRNGFRTLAKE